MFDRRELLRFAAAAAAAPSAMANAAPKAPRPHRPRSTEVHALRLFAEQTHPRGREARDDATWRARWTKLERSANGLDDGPYIVEARRALAWFEDGHTTVLPFEFVGKMPDTYARGAFGTSLPWRVKLFDDGAYVTATDAANEHLLGARIDQVGALSTGALLQAFDASWPGSRAWAHSWGATVFTSPGQLHGLAAVSDPIAPVPIRLSGAPRPAATLGPVRGKSNLDRELVRKKSDREGWAEAFGRANYVKLLPERRAAYVSIDYMEDLKGATFEQLTRDTFAAMESGAADRLIVDLRRNGGGDNYLGEPLRRYIERSSFNRPGRLFVLIGPATFSAAQNLTNRLERETYAIFVGAPTGLSPNHYGDARLFTGKVTGMVAAISSLPWFDSYPQDKREWIMPDILAPATFADWRAGRDPALETALGTKASGPPDDFSRDRIFYYARASQKQDWKPFWV